MSICQLASEPYCFTWPDGMVNTGPGAGNRILAGHECLPTPEACEVRRDSVVQYLSEAMGPGPFSPCNPM